MSLWNFLWCVIVSIKTTRSIYIYIIIHLWCTQSKGSLMYIFVQKHGVLPTRRMQPSGLILSRCHHLRHCLQARGVSWLMGGFYKCILYILYINIIFLQKEPYITLFFLIWPLGLPRFFIKWIGVLWNEVQKWRLTRPLAPFMWQRILWCLWVLTIARLSSCIPRPNCWTPPRPWRLWNMSMMSRNPGNKRYRVDTIHTHAF